MDGIVEIKSCKIPLAELQMEPGFGELFNCNYYY